MGDIEARLRAAMHAAADAQEAAPDALISQVKRRHRRHSALVAMTAALAAAAAAVTGVGVGVGLQPTGPGRGPVTIRGLLAVSRPQGFYGNNCPTALGLTGTARVTVRSPSGAVIGRARLGSGTAAAAGVLCEYPFTLRRVPGEARYRVSAVNGAAAWFTAGQVRRPIILRLGPPVPPVRTPLASLTGSDTAAGDGFGSSVAISGSVIVVGAPGHARSAGRVYVFTRAGGGWRQSAELAGSDTAAGDNFGTSVAISGGIIVVGAPGHAASAGRVYVFTRAGGGWRQSAELAGSDTAAGDHFGESVAASDSTIVVGISAHDVLRGRAYAFSKTSGRWSQSAEMAGFGPNGRTAVAVSGATIVVAASNVPPNLKVNSGRAYTYVKTAGGWRRSARLHAPGPGLSLEAAMSATTIVIISFGVNCGHAGVFTMAGHAWKLADELTGCVGLSVAVSGSTVVSGASVFTPAAGRWHLSALLADGGFASAISGQTAAVSPLGGRSTVGTVYLYRL